MGRLICITCLLAVNAVAQPASPEAVKLTLVRGIEEKVRNFDGVMGVAIIDLKTGEEIAVNADLTFPAGSSIKVAILIELYRQAAAGSLKLTEVIKMTTRDQVGGSGILQHLTPGDSQISLQDLSVLMIALSDNTATNILLERLGMARINQTLTDLGLSGIKLRRRMIDQGAMARAEENVATPREAVRLFELLASGKVISEDISQAVLRTLRIPKSSPIPRRLPSSVPVANKPGGVEGAACDWALVEVPGRPFVIAVMTTYNGETAEADNVIASIARMAYDLYSRLARSTLYGARVPLPLLEGVR